MKFSLSNPYPEKSKYSLRGNNYENWQNWQDKVAVKSVKDADC
jgi:hypothetical protein